MKRFVTRRRVLATVLSLAVALNVVAFLHAWSMTHFGGTGVKTRRTDLNGFLARARVLVTGVSLPRPTHARTPADLGLAFEEKRFEASDGVHLSGWRIPVEHPRGGVLLCHGYAGSMSTCLDEAAQFHALGYEIWLVDLRGCGGSDGAVTSIGYYESRDVAAAYRAMSAESLPHFIVFGQSMGAAATLRAVAADGIRPHALILENPFSTMLSAVQNRFQSFGLPSFPFSELMVFWGGAQQGFWAFSHRPDEYARQVDCPTLFMVGAHDTDATPVQVGGIAANVHAAARVEIFPDATHQALLAADRERWLRLVRNFDGEVFRPRETATK